MKKALLIGFTSLIVLAGVYSYLSYSPVSTSPKSAKIIYKLTATSLSNEYLLLETTANSKYLNQIIEVSGKVKQISYDEKEGVMLVIDAGNPHLNVNCFLSKDKSSDKNQIQKDDEVVVRGTCKGLNKDIRIENCSILQKTSFVF